MPARKAKYGDIMTDLESGYTERAKFEKANVYMQEAAFGSEAVILGFRLFGLKMQLATDPKDAAESGSGRGPCASRMRMNFGRTTTPRRTRR